MDDVTRLAIARDVTLPIDVATEAVAILARRGRGKTYTAAVVAEELHKAGQPFVVLDPTGAWWGLRASADGEKPGLPVTIIGGDHGDVPLEPTAGKLLASFVVDNPGAFVLDLSGLESNAAQDRFVTAFAERLYRAKGHDRRPLTLIVDEADSFAPQRPMPGQQTMLGAFEAIVRRGRIRGLGVVLITQRPAVLNKNVLTQAGMLVLLGITSPQDRDAVDDWIKGHAEPDERKQVMASLARLNVGEAWVWWPTEDLLQRTTIRQRRTFDSSATPKAGEQVGDVAFARVDLDALKDAIAETIERERNRDPDTLQARIRDLERELRQRPTEIVTETVIEQVEVPVLDAGLVDRLQAALQPAVDVLDRLGTIQASLSAPTPQRPKEPPQRPTPVEHAPRPRATPPAAVEGLSGQANKMLAALASRHPLHLTEQAWATWSGYSKRSSQWAPSRRQLEQAGLIDRDHAGYYVTDTGMATAGVDPSLPTTREAVIALWSSRLPRNAQAFFDVIAAADGRWVDRDELAEITGYSRSSSQFEPSIRLLVKNGLADAGPDGVRLNEAAVS